MESFGALALIKQMPENKEQIASFIRSAREDLLSGNHNPIEIDIRLKIMEEIISGIRKDEAIKEQLIDEIEKYPEKTVRIYGCEIQKRNSSTYNYKCCNDSELELLQNEYDFANEKLKQRQELLKMIKPQSLVNPKTGEFLEPPLITTKTVLAIKIL